MYTSLRRIGTENSAGERDLCVAIFENTLIVTFKWSKICLSSGCCSDGLRKHFKRIALSGSIRSLIGFLQQLLSQRFLSQYLALTICIIDSELFKFCKMGNYDPFMEPASDIHRLTKRCFIYSIISIDELLFPSCVNKWPYIYVCNRDPARGRHHLWESVFVSPEI